VRVCATGTQSAMALDEYRGKRDFTKSPEPAGDLNARGRGGPRFFCVQKHLASHLHYDFRIEHKGVLLSWAVPKGPAVDPTVKRLAMHVEDHPLEYGTFEGVIPSGYGAGIVMLWDEGTWEPEVDDVDAALRKGDLKLRLNGAKLKGSWALVRTRTAGERSWLLIKHRDEWAGPLDIAEFAPLSVKTGGDFADILAQENPAIWQSHRPAQGGDAGAMFARIIERALAIKAGHEEASPAPRAARTARATATSPGAAAAAPARTSRAKTRKAATPAKAAGRKQSKPAPRAAAKRAAAPGDGRKAAARATTKARKTAQTKR
jgi:bifunctional non-homologous end joining protein LigD